MKPTILNVIDWQAEDTAVPRVGSTDTQLVLQKTCVFFKNTQSLQNMYNYTRNPVKMLIQGVPEKT